METKHLSTGSTCPPQDAGLLRCYSMKYCPYAQRTRLMLQAKKVPHDIVNVNLKQKPEWFFDKNPLGKVPALELDGRLMFESLVTADYLDEAYPEPPMYPADPWKKANDRVFIELWAKVSSSLYKIYFAKGDKEVEGNAFKDVEAGLKMFEDELATRGTTYFFGDRPGMLDYMIWPWAERLPMAQLMAGYTIPKNSFPKMFSWMEAMKQDGAVKATYHTPEIHLKFLKSYASGNPDYDM